MQGKCIIFPNPTHDLNTINEHHKKVNNRDMIDLIQRKKKPTWLDWEYIGSSTFKTLLGIFMYKDLNTLYQTKF